MAVLTASELTELRQDMAREYLTVTWIKSDINAAVQAYEDAYELVDFKAAVDAAGTFRFSDVQIKTIGACYNKQKSRRESV